VSEIAPNDPAEEGLDNTPPELISVDIESLSRTTGPVFDIDEDGNVLGGEGSSCDGHSFLNLNVEATDDRSELSQLRARVTVVSGESPIDFGGEAWGMALGGLAFYWLEGTEQGLPALSFVLEIRVVDRAHGPRGPRVALVGDADDLGRAVFKS
jgi:hypothetical protein